MATDKQKAAAKENIKKAQKRWQEMTPEEHALAQPEARKRAKPGTKGEGDYFRIEHGERGNSLRFATRMLVKRAIF